MSRTGWKSFERLVAKQIGGSRYPANTGGPIDVCAPGVFVQCKEVRHLSLAVLEKLAVEIDLLGRSTGTTGIVAVKRSAGRGRRSVPLVVLTLEAWCR